MKQRYILTIALLLVLTIFGCGRKEKTNSYTEEGRPARPEEPISHRAKNPSTQDSTTEEEPTNEQEPEPVESNGNYLAIVVDDFGNSGGSLLADFCKLDPAVTFAIIPDLPASKETMRKAVSSNHEVIIHVPMEPENAVSNNPGKNAIYTDLTEAEIAKRMEGFIDQLPYAVGINNHMGSKATSDVATMRAVMSVLKKHDLFFLDSNTIASTVVGKVARQSGVPSAKRQLFLDVPDNSDATIASKLDYLRKAASKNQNVIAITHCHNKTKLEQLKKFIKQARALGFELVPVSDLMGQTPSA